MAPLPLVGSVLTSAHVAAAARKIPFVDVGAADHERRHPVEIESAMLSGDAFRI
jgi:hypothetical protein